MLNLSNNIGIIVKMNKLTQLHAASIIYLREVYG